MTHPLPVRQVSSLTAWVWELVVQAAAIMVKDIFIMVRREKATLFLCCKEETTVKELKMMIEGITKKPPDDQQLIKDDQPLADEGKTLGDYGFTTATAKAQTPAQVNLVYKAEDGTFEPVRNIEYSSPPELPDVMKPQEGAQSGDNS